MSSTLSNLTQFVTLIEDGADINTCKAIKVDICRYLQKYDFDTQKRQMDISTVAKMKFS
jgi:hypothetical protein